MRNILAQYFLSKHLFFKTQTKGTLQTRAIAVDNHVYLTTEMNPQLLVLDSAFLHTEGQSYR